MAGESDLLLETGEGAGAPDAPPANESPWEQRILQLDGKRYSLRLEHEFWAALEAIACRRRLRLNHLVAEIASHRPSDTNLSSQLRVFCLGETESAPGGRSIALDGANATALVEAAPMPGLLLDADQIVLAANEAFLHWSGVKRALLLRRKLAAWFRLQSANDFDALWSRRAREDDTRIVGVMPGRVLAADAKLVPLTARGRQLCVVWVAS